MGGCFTASPNAFAFGEVGRWTSGWAQGTSEYTVVNAQRDSLCIACGDSPVFMTLTVGGKEYGSGNKSGFSLIIDGLEIQTPYDTRSRAGANNFMYAWDGLRKAKTLQAKTEDGKVISLPLVGAAKELPRSMAKNFACSVAF